MSTSASRRRAYHHGNLPASLLRAAGEVLEKRGVGGLSVRRLASRVGVSHSAPYRHYPDRESLLAALATEGFARLDEGLRDAAQAGGLRAMGEAYVRFAVEHPQRFRLMFGGELPMARYAALRESASRAFEGLSRTLAPQLPGDAGRDASIAAWALAHGLAQLLLNDRIASTARRDRSPDDFVRAVLGSVRFAAVR
jgi:AcrR family transcriptional regulator